MLMLSIPFLTINGLILANGLFGSVEEISKYFGIFLLLLPGVGSLGFLSNLVFSMSVL